MIVKPTWESAPEWAQWLAMGPDGYWIWFETKPEFKDGGWNYSWVTQQWEVVSAYLPAAASLEGRPT